MKEKKDKKLPIKKRIGQTAKSTGLGLLGVAGGTGAAAGLGSLAPFAGLVMLGAGYFLGGKWQLLTIAGAATLGYGVAKSQENRIQQGVKDRMIDFKNDWLHAFYIDKLTNKPEDGMPDTTIGAIDTSELDSIIEQVEEEGVRFAASMTDESSDSHLEISEPEEEDFEEANYTLIEDELDFESF